MARTSSSNPTVRNALHAARNDAYSNYTDLRLMKTFALTELAALDGRVEEAEQAISAHAADFRKTCRRGLEAGYIDTCERKCLAALKEVRARLARQRANVMQ